MKKVIFFTSIVAIISMQSCKNIYYSGNSLEPGITFNGTTNASLELYVDTNIILKGSSTTKVVLGIFKSSDNVFSDSYVGGIADQEKRAAMYKALQNTNYDLIVLPKYKIETYNGLFSKSTTCYVEGYGGKYMLKNAKYINSSNIQRSETERYKETPAYKYETQKLMNFMDEIGNYTSMEISNPNEIVPNDIIQTPNNSFGVVLTNNSGIVKYLTNPAPDKFEVQDEKYSNLKKMKKN
jgi:hypothetical protein